MPSIDTHAMRRLPPSKQNFSQIEVLLKKAFEDQDDLPRQAERPGI